MKTPSEVKFLSRIYPKIRKELKSIVDYAKENPACNYFFFVPEEMVKKDEPENFPTFKKMVEDLVDKVESMTSVNYKISLHNEFWHYHRQLISDGYGGGPGYIHLVVQTDPSMDYCISHSGSVWCYRNLCGKITLKGEYKPGRVSYGGRFMYDETIDQIKRERELAKTDELLKYLKSQDENKIRLSIEKLFSSSSDLTIPYILQIIKEWKTFAEIFTVKGKNISDLEVLAISISENKTKFSKLARTKIIPFCNSHQFDVQYLAMKTMKGKWTRADKEKLTKILVRGNFAIQLLKLEAMTKIKHPDTATLAHKLLKDINELVRNAAIDALGEIGKEKELNSLQNIGKDAKKRDMYDPGRLIKAINGIKDRLVK